MSAEISRSSVYFDHQLPPPRLNPWAKEFVPSRESSSLHPVHTAISWRAREKQPVNTGPAAAHTSLSNACRSTETSFQLDHQACRRFPPVPAYDPDIPVYRPAEAKHHFWASYYRPGDSRYPHGTICHLYDGNLTIRGLHLQPDADGYIDLPALLDKYHILVVHVPFNSNERNGNTDLRPYVSDMSGIRQIDSGIGETDLMVNQFGRVVKTDGKKPTKNGFVDAQVPVRRHDRPVRRLKLVHGAATREYWDMERLEDWVMKAAIEAENDKDASTGIRNEYGEIETVDTDIILPWVHFHLHNNNELILETNGVVVRKVGDAKYRVAGESEALHEWEQSPEQVPMQQTDDEEDMIESENSGYGRYGVLEPEFPTEPTPTPSPIDPRQTWIQAAGQHVMREAYYRPADSSLEEIWGQLTRRCFGIWI
jgi:hypothetical protein